MHRTLMSHPAIRYGHFLALVAVLLSLSAASGQTADQLDITLRIQLGEASQIIIPQSRGFVLPNPPTRVPVNQPAQIESVEARVNILEQTASTTMEVRLRNPSSQQAEAVILLPVPAGAVVSAFTFEGSASEPTAQLLPRDEARRLYDAIVAKVRDPALLEFAGYNIIRSSVFPIAAGGTQKVRLTYENLLESDGERVDYVLPRSESLDRRAPWTISLDVQSPSSAISTIYSPSHAIETQRQSPRHFAVRLAEKSKLDPGSFRLSVLREKNSNHNGVTASVFAYPDPKVGGGWRGVLPFDGGIAGFARR